MSAVSLNTPTPTPASPLSLSHASVAPTPAATTQPSIQRFFTTAAAHAAPDSTDGFQTAGRGRGRSRSPPKRNRADSPSCAAASASSGKDERRTARDNGLTAPRSSTSRLTLPGATLADGNRFHALDGEPEQDEATTASASRAGLLSSNVGLLAHAASTPTPGGPDDAAALPTPPTNAASSSSSSSSDAARSTAADSLLTASTATAAADTTDLTAETESDDDEEPPASARTYAYYELKYNEGHGDRDSEPHEQDAAEPMLLSPLVELGKRVNNGPLSKAVQAIPLVQLDNAILVQGGAKKVRTTKQDKRLQQYAATDFHAAASPIVVAKQLPVKARGTPEQLAHAAISARTEAVLNAAQPAQQHDPASTAPPAAPVPPPTSSPLSPPAPPAPSNNAAHTSSSSASAASLEDKALQRDIEKLQKKHSRDARRVAEQAAELDKLRQQKAALALHSSNSGGQQPRQDQPQQDQQQQQQLQQQTSPPPPPSSSSSSQQQPGAHRRAGSRRPERRRQARRTRSCSASRASPTAAATRSCTS